MPVRNCCDRCQGPMGGPCGPMSHRRYCTNTSPCCVHTIGNMCCSPCGDFGCIHGPRCGVAGSYYSSCGHGCIGGCTGGLCESCCGPACG